MPCLKPFLDDLPIPPVVKPFGNLFTAKHLAIKAKVKHVQLHQDLPYTEVWSYRLAEGTVVQFGSSNCYLGPTVVVDKDDFVNVRWENKVLPTASATGKLPFEVVKVDSAVNPAEIPQNMPGQIGALTDVEDHLRHQLQGLEAALVTHLL